MRLIVILVLVGCLHLAMLATSPDYFWSLGAAAHTLGGSLTWLLVRVIAWGAVLFLIVAVVIVGRNWLESR